MQDPGRFEMHGQRWVPQTKDFILAASVQWGIPGDRAHPHSDPCLSKSPEAPSPRGQASAAAMAPARHGTSAGGHGTTRCGSPARGSEKTLPLVCSPAGVFGELCFLRIKLSKL